MVYWFPIPTACDKYTNDGNEFEFKFYILWVIIYPLIYQTLLCFTLPFIALHCSVWRGWPLSWFASLSLWFRFFAIHSLKLLFLVFSALHWFFFNIICLKMDIESNESSVEIWDTRSRISVFHLIRSRI